MNDIFWHYVKDNQQAGPVTLETLSELIRDGAVNGDTLVWREGMPEWLALKSVEELKPILSNSRGGLKLGTRRMTSEPVNVAPTPVDHASSTTDVGGRDVGSLLRENVAIEENLNRPGGFWAWFYGNSFEFNAFIVMLTLTVVGTGIVHFVRPEFVETTIFIAGFSIMAVGGITFRVRTFQEGALWGILGILIGVSDIVFIFMHWGRSWRALLLILAGFALVIGSAMIFAPGEMDESFWQEVLEEAGE